MRVLNNQPRLMHKVKAVRKLNQKNYWAQEVLK